MGNFADRLHQAVSARGAPVCAGIDPRADWIPDEFYDRAFSQHGRSPAGVRAAVREFCLQVLEVIAPFVPVIKPQAAFFEALGPGGWDDFSAVCARGRELGLIVIADVKRGDIGSTAEAYAASLFGSSRVKDIALSSCSADAATVNPYLGADGVEPFVLRAREHGAGVFVLARTSNPGSAQFQELALAKGGTLVDEVAVRIHEWGSGGVGRYGFSDVGAVVGATHADAAARMRAIMPNAWFLVPGWGAQGGAAETVRACFKGGMGAIVNSSRGVMHAYAAGPLKDHGPARWREAVEKAARQFHAEIKAIAGG